MIRQQMKKQNGFTLIEIAIVLVIIGPLLGGVLKGQELINTARVRALNNSIDGITAAWFSFQDRYRAFPGDYLQARAVVNLPGITVGGDGNGAVAAGAESANVWTHLEAAGYITGGYDGNAANTTVALQYACPVTTCPDNGFGTGIMLLQGVEVRSPATPSAAHELITGQGVPVEVLAELDRKVDDGVATTGLMQVGKAATYNPCVATTDYELQTPVDNCAAVFRNF